MTDDSEPDLEATARRTVEPRPGDPLIGTVVDGRFEVRSLLGRGGMGAVYLAYQASVGREVALKVLLGHFQHDDELVKRFEREIRICAQLSHPNVVTVHDAGISNGTLFMAMERLTGRTLSDLLVSGPLDPKRAAQLAAQICDALARAHERGVVHRDIKASNVMVLERDLVKVLDFGIATIQSGERFTATGGVIGSPNAIAPEVLRSPRNVSPKADLYAVGTLLFEALTGQPPFGNDTANAVFMRQLSTTPPALPATLPPGLRALVHELIDPDPDKRPPSAAAVRERLLAPQTLAVSHTGTVLELNPRSGRSRRALTMGLGAGALLVAAAAAGWTLRRDAPAEVPRPVEPARAPVEAPPAPAPMAVVDAGPAGDASAPPREAPASPPIVDAGVQRIPAPRPSPRRPPKTSDYQE